MTSIASACLLAALLAIPAGARAEERPARLLLFDVELLDSSGEGEHPDHAGRLKRVTDLMRTELESSGRYSVMPAGQSGAADAPPPSVAACSGCELDLGRRAGAAVVATGVIRKVSSLILSIDITLRNVEDGSVVARGVADIRGDNERSWRRGVDWLLRHRILAPSR
ncbi:DUF3280 domain-containing protein [Azospirillum thermophilum]|uniref:DUF2380 domain-containing protein n=1 Tax=Azospirillum thermophilum TaxID=2202148 RepID=A0A2S2CY66_9PROT|nr:DUF3280 domain-containing protein [Azospirillum thermophilum]AWK89350.1 hypothetical protein DEW08_25240 [Azospirillum thermophilum]